MLMSVLVNRSYRRT